MARLLVESVQQEHEWGAEKRYEPVGYWGQF